MNADRITCIYIIAAHKVAALVGDRTEGMTRRGFVGPICITGTRRRQVVQVD